MGHKRKGQVAKELRAMNAAGRQCDRARLTPEQQLQVLKDDRPGLSRAEVLKLRERMKILVGPLHG